MIQQSLLLVSYLLVYGMFKLYMLKTYFYALTLSPVPISVLLPDVWWEMKNTLHKYQEYIEVYLQFTSQATYELIKLLS